jgi:hypothetical protein
MKRFVLFALVLVLASAVVLAALQAPVRGADAYAARVCTNVGWNTRVVCTVNVSAEPEQSVAAWVYPPVYTPNVGWNT